MMKWRFPTAGSLPARHSSTIAGVENIASSRGYNPTVVDMTAQPPSVAISNVCKQIAAALVCAQSFCILGFAVGTGGVLFHQETDNADGDPSQLDRATWLASAFALGNIPGNIGSAMLLSRLGAKRLMLFSTPLAATGALMIGAGTTFAITVSGRFLVGIYFGITEGPARSYVGEVSSIRLRGISGNVLNIMGQLCIVVIFGLGSLVPWRHLEFACVMTSTLVQALAILPFPESAKWLLARGYPHATAEKSLRFFLGAETDVKQEIAAVEASFGSSSSKSLRDTVLLMTSKASWKPTLLLLAQFTCMVFSGGLGVGQFAPTVLDATGLNINPYHGSMMIAAVVGVSFLVSGPLLERFGRVPMLQFAGVVGTIGCSAMGAFFYLDAHPWLVLVGAALNMVSYGAGIAPVTFVYLVELLPNSIRSVTINVVLLYFSVTQWACIHFFPAVARIMGNYGIMWLFAAVNVVQFLLATFLLPETSGLSLEDIHKRNFSKSAADVEMDTSNEYPK